jgi:hypothetical protein
MVRHDRSPLPGNVVYRPYPLALLEAREIEEDPPEL